MAKRRLLCHGSKPSRAKLRSSNVKHYNNVPLPLMVAREIAEQVLFVIPFHLTSIHLPCTLIHCMTSRVQTTQFKLTLKYLHLQDAKQQSKTLETISIYAATKLGFGCSTLASALWFYCLQFKIPHRCRRFARVGFKAAQSAHPVDSLHFRIAQIHVT